MFDENLDTFEKIEQYMRMVAVRLIVFAVGCFCLGYATV